MAIDKNKDFTNFFKAALNTEVSTVTLEVVASVCKKIDDAIDTMGRVVEHRGDSAGDLARLYKKSQASNNDIRQKANLMVVDYSQNAASNVTMTPGK